MLKLVNNQNILSLSMSQLYHAVDNRTISSNIDLESFKYNPEFILTPLFHYTENFYSKSLILTPKGLIHTHSDDIFINEYITSFLAAATNYLKNRLPNEDFCSFIFKQCSNQEYIDFLEKYTSEGNTLYSLNIRIFDYHFKIFS